ncbi:hypothetical protein TCAL_05840 [Tigriopus californicus]|uniref:Protein LMBR1L n=1 Tax=Tigriopus californicus TaxID=6832 RepID=A0A553P7R1_TIGCA|nr:protein LMBR1L-like [Tigriopus californicus]TRY73725.1 hypothetical protein TCAL_05840 [Tigriopus californicus]
MDALLRDDPFYNPDQVHSPYEEEFNKGIREITILVLTGLGLYLGSYYFLNLWRQKRDTEEEFLPYSWEDDMVYKVSFCFCVFSLAVSVGAALLLPISTISNEILLHYPKSWYIKWLNSSLIQGIWNLIFILSNLSLFGLLPFAYLFCESEGLAFFGNKRGLLARAKETIVTLILLSLTVLGMMYVIAALVDHDRDSMDRILNVYSYLPFLYSCVSFLGVIMLLICTPLGFARLFTVVGDLVVRPTFMRNQDDDYFATKFEEESLKAKVANCKDKNFLQITPITNEERRRLRGDEIFAHFQKSLDEVTARRIQLERARNTPSWRRILGYPLVMMFVFALTTISLICVISNVGQIITGFRSLPVKPMKAPNVVLGSTSLSALGVFGVIIEVILIFYLMVTSLIGLYIIPPIGKIRPRREDTSLTRLILNCGLYVILSSALPLLSKILGITNFDLLGSFGEVKWLGNIYIVLFYNAVFAGTASFCLFNKFTARVRQEILRRIHLYLSTIFKRNIDAKFVASISPVTAGSSSPTSLKAE